MGGAVPERTRPGVSPGGSDDEELLQGGRPAFRVVVVERAALSIGIAVDPDAPFVQRARELGLLIQRRSSGGTGVLLAPGDITWAVVLPRTDPRVGRDFVSAYGRLGAPVTRYLEERGWAAVWSPSPASSSDCCLLGGRGRVLTCPRGILSGAAQHLTRLALLHQGTFPRRVDRPLHRAVFATAENVAFDRLIGTDDLGLTEGPEELRDGLAAGFAQFVEFTG